MTKPINVLSLFDGISCAKLALKKLGMPVKTYFSSEICKHANQVSRLHFPEMVRLGDVRTVGKVDTEIDLLIGGSPCQDLSVNKNNRQGLSGDRSSLFYEFVRVLKENKPKHFILENVASMRPEDKNIISRELYGVQPVIIDAALVSAQRRKRLFWVGVRSEGGYKPALDVLFQQPHDKGILLKDILQEESTVPDYCYVPQDIYERMRIKFGDTTTDVDGKAKSLCKKHETRKSTNFISCNRIGGYDNERGGKRLYSTEGKSITLLARGGGGGGYASTGIYKVSDRIRKLTPIECERLMGVPDNYTNCLAKTNRYKVLGNAFNVDVVAYIFNNIYD